MENIYREALRKKGRGAEAQKSCKHPLFQTNWSYKNHISYTFEKNINMPEPIQREKVRSEVTEKTQILDSLNLFKGEKELGRRSEEKSEGACIFNFENVLRLSPSEMQREFLKASGEAFLNRRFLEKRNHHTSPVRVVFVTDDTLDELYEASSGLAEFSIYYSADVSQLLSRMIKAMKLENDDFLMSSVQIRAKDRLELLCSELILLKPDLVITLGAQATSSLLKSNKRLKDIHGQISKIHLRGQDSNEYQLNIMPLFSPTLLQTAPNMKKTAWKDMQGAMTFLNL